MSTLFSLPVQIPLTSSAGLYPGAKAYFYVTGSTTPKSVYTSADLTTPHSNPVVADANGQFAPIWLDTDEAYRVHLKTSAGVTISGYPIDGVGGTTLTRSTIGDILYPTTAAETLAGVTPSARNYPVGDIRRYGAVVNGSTDDTAAINAAISVAKSGGATVYIPVGTTAHASTLVLQNGIVLKGEGCSFAGSILKYTGTGDQIQVNNASNSSTLANIRVEDVWLKSQYESAGKANFADNGSTFIYFTRVRFSGARINLILDQSECIRIRDCLFQDVANSASGTGIWIVNGAERTGGNASGYTNEILVEGCQFNSSSTLPCLIADDGGFSHKFRNNNFNGGASCIRVCGGYAMVIDGNEIESCDAAGVDFYTTKYDGSAGVTGGVSTTVTINGNHFVTGSRLSISASVASSVWSLTVRGNNFSTSGAVFNLTGIVREFAAEGNEQMSTGDDYFSINNYFSQGSWTTSWTASAGTPAIGDGALYTLYSRKGKEVTCRINLTVGSTTTTGTAGSAWSFSAPVAAASNNINYAGSVMALCAGSAPTQGVPWVASGGSAIQIRNTGGAVAAWGGNTPGTWANGDYVQLEVTYKAANWLA